jgi:hypothetical protein
VSILPRARWKDLRASWPERDAWTGLEVEVDAPAQPTLMVRAGRGGRIQLSGPAGVVATARVRDDHWGTVTEVVRPAPRALPPITAASARATEGAPAWARWLARELLGASVSPLHAGTWHILRGAADVPYARHVEHWARVPEQQAMDEQRWDFTLVAPPLAVRPLPPTDAPRVKAWRRAAREGVLPPIFLWYVSGLDRHVILDGHERLVAALAEGVTPGSLVLASMCADFDEARADDLDAGLARRPHVEAQNRALVQIYDDTPRPRTRAWPLLDEP